MPNTYMMRNEHDCGLSAVTFATGLQYENVADLWGYPNKDNFIDDLRDNPGSHFRVLDKLGISYKRLSVIDVLDARGVYTSDKIILLLHQPSHPYLSQHWVVLHRVTKCYVYYHSGQTGIVKVAKDHMRTMLECGWPECVYEINQPKNSKDILWKLWDKLLSFIF